jgi:hypothetical protein
MKRYWAFFGSYYYPLGGMNDFLSDHDVLGDALIAIAARALMEARDQRQYYWAHIWDCVDRKIVWDTENDESEENQTAGLKD